MQEPTRTAQTEVFYLERAVSLAKRFQRENKMADLDPYKFVDWMIANKKNWETSTWRLYKNSACYFISENLSLPELAKKLQEEPSSGCKKTTKKSGDAKTSRKKTKKINVKKLAAIEKRITRIATEEKDIGYMALIFILRLALYTGLRPSEFEHAQLLSGLPEEGIIDEPVLRVLNGKNTNGRSHGKYRHLILKNYSEKKIAIIKTAIDIYLNPEHPDGYRTREKKHDTFKAFYSCLRMLLQRANKGIKPYTSTISFYTCRHQLIANCKASGSSKVEIAALFGHKSDQTAGRHYGKKQWGDSKSDIPIALESEMSLIHQKSSDQKLSPNQFV